MKRLKTYNWKAISIALLVVILSFGAWQYLSTKTNQAETQRKLEAKSNQLTDKIKELDSTKSTTKQLEETKKQLELQKAELEKQLQAKRSTPQVYAAAAPKVTPPPAVGTTNCGSDPYMAYIYQHESGCRTTALNSIGCYGIGQSCPASKIAHCGASFECQDAWFRNYAVTRYGSTQAAYNFWLSHKWW
jgi:uncharacterized membrane-anchored protein YhcB (DUF1043 family)